MAVDEWIQIQSARFLNINACRALEILGILTEDDKARTVGFVNAHCVNVARKDPDYRKIINNFDAVLPDGIGLDIAARLRGTKIKENLNGTDFSPRIFDFFARTRKTVFLLGGHSGVAEQAGRILSERHKGLIVCGCSHGYDLDERDAEICKTILDAHPDVILVSMGTPIQEKWIDAHKNLFGKKLFLSVGGLLNFIVGIYPRAPLWLRKIKMEWFFRLCGNPKLLWKRYLIGNQAFLFHAVQEALEERKKKHSGEFRQDS